jgi:hypothetical protein
LKNKSAAVKTAARGASAMAMLFSLTSRFFLIPSPGGCGNGALYSIWRAGAFRPFVRPAAFFRCLPRLSRFLEKRL